MTSRRILGSVALVLALGLATSCSDDKKSSTTDAPAAVSKADFLEYGNVRCATFNAEVDAAIANVVTENDQIAVFTDVIIPGLRDTLTDLEGFGFPTGDEATIQAMIDDTRDVLDTAEADPGAALGASVDPFAAINARLVAYGLTTCGQAD